VRAFELLRKVYCARLTVETRLVLPRRPGYDPDGLTVVASIIAGLALAFTLASFWWLNARRGSLEVARPLAFSFVTREGMVRLRLPLAFYNTGAAALLVSDLRVLVDDRALPPLRWFTTRAMLRAMEDDFAFPTPFAVEGRGTREVVVEFGEHLAWVPKLATNYWMTLEAQVHPAAGWKELISFEWWAPPSADNLSTYITYRNNPGGE
jgi:hypothetical protein